MTINRNGLTSTAGLGLNVFSRDELNTLHHGACHILKHTGVLVELEDAAERFNDAGALVPISDADRQALPFRVVLLLYRSEECIHISKDNGTRPFLFRFQRVMSRRFHQR